MLVLMRGSVGREGPRGEEGTTTLGSESDQIVCLITYGPGEHQQPFMSCPQQHNICDIREGPAERVVIPSRHFFHSKLRLGNFPKPFLVWDKPQRPEAFYRDEPFWNTAKLRWIPPVEDGGVNIIGYKIYRNEGRAGLLLPFKGEVV